MAEPLPTCLLNGEFLPLRAARISPLDRSFLYGDGVYEVFPVFGGRPFRFEQHLDRLDRSLAAIRMDNPHPRQDWRAMTAGLLAHNRAAAAGGDVYVYLQVSRGAEYGRSHAPLPQVPRTVFGFCAPLPRPSAARLAEGFACTTAQDTRWARCDIKSVSLLANVLLRQLSVDAGTDETILLRDGHLVEASASSVHVVVRGRIVAPAYSTQLLPGTTRDATEELAGRLGLPVEHRPVPEAELRGADEIWIEAATRCVQAVTRLDGRPVGGGRPGPLALRMRAAYEDWLREHADQPW
jgi:D-alanine transaminase